MSQELSVIADSRLMGYVRATGKRLDFRYVPAWQADPAAFPLSLAMPLQVAEHAHGKIDPWLRGLLPDNVDVLEQWGRRFQVSKDNPFKLLWHVGEDCPGAVQFVPREREGDLLGGTPPGAINWLSADKLSALIAGLLENPANTRRATDSGQFSLAGAQPKTALYLDPQDGKRWGVPSGRTPTTHILKPATARFDGFAENEHFCLELARRLGLLVPDSRVIHPGGQAVIVVTRYDRLLLDGRYRRIHQEDLCQALSVDPDRKYEHDGGPGAKEIGELLRASATESLFDLRSFAAALAFHWLVGATDAHAKNYSLLMAGGRQVFLAPFYDLASALPYPEEIYFPKVKLAMRIGSEYVIRKITRRHWEACARGLGIPAKEMLELVASFAERLPDLAVTTAHALHKEKLKHPVIGRIVDALAKHVRKCREGLVKEG